MKCEQKIQLLFQSDSTCSQFAVSQCELCWSTQTFPGEREAHAWSYSVKDIFLNKSMYRQPLIHTIQTSSTEHCIKSVCPIPNPVLSCTTILETDSAPHQSCTTHSKSSSIRYEYGHMTLTFRRENFWDCAHCGEFAKAVTKWTSTCLSHLYITILKTILEIRWLTVHK